MFNAKKKCKYPDPPEPPTWAMMEEDMKEVSKLDILFSLRTKHEQETEILLPSAKSGEDNKLPRPTDDEILSLALKLVQQQDKLVEDVKILEEKREHFNCINNNLKEKVENVKKKALTAMSKS